MNSIPAFNGPGVINSQQIIPTNSAIQAVPFYNTQIPQQIQTFTQPNSYGTSMYALQPQYPSNQANVTQHIPSSSQHLYRMTSTSDEEFLGFEESEQNNITNENPWQEIKKRVKKRKINKDSRHPETTTNNKFSPLANEPGDETSDTINNADGSRDKNTEENVTPRPPPIFIYGVINCKEMEAKINTVVERKQYITKTLIADNTVKIISDTPDTYRKIIKLMRDNNVIHHTYQPKDERAYRIVIKYLHHTTDIDEIKTELAANGHTVRNVMNCKSRITKEPLNLFFVDLEPANNNKDIYKLKNLQNRAILVEPPKKTKGITQCMRCQQYGHSRSYCNRPYVCVKCGGSHNTTTCTKSKDVPARCALCDGPHPANYKGCAFYHNLTRSNNTNNRMNIQQNSSNKTNSAINQIPTTVPHIQHPHQNHKTYANALKNGSEQQTDINQIMNKFLEEFKNMFQQLIQQNSMVLNMLTTLISKIQ